MFYNLYVLSLKNIKQNVIIINNRGRKREKERERGERSMFITLFNCNFYSAMNELPVKRQKGSGEHKCT